MNRSGTHARTLIVPALLVLLVIAATFALGAYRRRSITVLPDVKTRDGRVMLPNGWHVTPAGHAIALPGDMPLKMIVSPDGKYLLVNTGGFHDHTVSVLDLQTEKLTQSVNVYKDWAGMCLDAEGDDVYVSGGGPVDAAYPETLKKEGASSEETEILSKPVYRLSFQNGALALRAGFDIAGLDNASRYIAGVALGRDDSLYVIDINHDTVYRLGGHPRQVEASGKAGYRPYSLALSPDGGTLAVSNWGDESVSLLDPTTLQEMARVKVGSHPNELIYSSDGRLFVANGGSNSVSVLRGKQVLETIITSLDPHAPVGSTPVALALTPDGKRLFVANADNNDVAVVDVSQFDPSGKNSEARVLGFIPTGWYPSALAVSHDGKKLYVGTGKGLQFRNNVPYQTSHPDTTYDGKTKFDYIGTVLSGAVSVVDLPDAKHLAAYSRQVRANLPLPITAQVSKAQIADVTQNAFANIKHVLYIIRENRTYDQVFSDMPQGNGDPKLTMYGEQITPNAHALVKATVLLDNIYCNGEVSEDGHEWCNAAYATDFKEKAWINSYSGRKEPDADDRLSESPAGYLWDNCERHHVSYRSYGEYAEFKSSPDSPPQFTGNPTLNAHSSLAWWKAGEKPDARDTDHAAIFIQELHEAEQTGDWPQYMVMSLGEDHTRGLRAGSFTPFASVGSNDLALGQIVDAISHSRFWKETAIFVIEDDAQNGPDHVDAHRTVGLVISPYVKHGAVDSTFYTTASMVHTIELILHLPPMTQYDAAATPLYNAFTSQPTLTAYNCLPAQTDLAARNPAQGEGARISARMDLLHYDRADPDVLNRLLWENAKPGVPMPAPVRSARLDSQSQP